MWSILLPVLIMLLRFPRDGKPWWSVQTTGTDTNLRGVSVKDVGGIGKMQYVVWASGSHGVVLRSVNGGESWKQLEVPGGGDLDFRDIVAFDEDVAYLMSSGDGEKSRIYKTVNGGKNWKMQRTDRRAGFFLDSLACDSKTHCVALSDPVDGKFLLLSTNDGEHWEELSREQMPAALAKEGAFAASGTAIAMCESGIYFGTGGPKARIFHSADQGRTWSVAETPLLSGNASSGVFSIACYGSGDLVAVGGDYNLPSRADRVAIYSDDRGETWKIAATQPGGYRSAVGSFSYGDFAAVGPNGTDVSEDKGVHWTHTDYLNLNAASFEGTAGWGVGPQGTIAKFDTHLFYNIRNTTPSQKSAAARTLSRGR